MKRILAEARSPRASYLFLRTAAGEAPRRRCRAMRAHNTFTRIHMLAVIFGMTRLLYYATGYFYDDEYKQLAKWLIR